MIAGIRGAAHVARRCVRERAVSRPHGVPMPNPVISTVPFGHNAAPHLSDLTVRDQAALAAISTVIRSRAHADLIRRGDPAEAIYNLVEGVACVYRDRPMGRRRVLGFLFPGDLCGLARQGTHINSIRTITPATFFRIPVASLTSLLLKDAKLQLHFLCKATQGVRESQRHIMMLARRRPSDRLATFLSMLDDMQGGKGAVALPMTIEDASDWLDLPARAVVHALHVLESRRIVSFDGEHGVTILDRVQLHAIAAAE